MTAHVSAPSLSLTPLQKAKVRLMPRGRILIVEGDESTGIGLAELLEGEGCRVRVVDRFEDGVTVIGTDPPDLLWLPTSGWGHSNGLQLVMRGQPGSTRHRHKARARLVRNDGEGC